MSGLILSLATNSRDQQPSKRSTSSITAHMKVLFLFQLFLRLIVSFEDTASVLGS